MSTLQRINLILFPREMAATDGQIILAASRFGDTTPVYLRDFSKQKLPAVAKISKGQHQNLGVPSLAAPSLQSTALFLSAGKKYQILAQPIKIKEGRRPTNIGCKVLIPDTYLGYFELLSEDGRSTRCIDSVLELSKRRNLRVLVRETFRCAHINRTIQAGEMLTTINDNGNYLQCKNVQDEIINLPLETKAKFSPIAKEDSISGVHSAKNLLLKRMPVIVRLVHGTAPKGLKQPFVPELRLLGCVETDRIFALPLQKDTDLISVPLNAKIKLQRAKNMEQLENFIEYSRFLEKAERLLSDERDRIQVIDIKSSEKEKKDFRLHGQNRLLSFAGISTGDIGSLAVLENGLRRNEISNPFSKTSQGLQQSSQIPDEYNEIDHIYDYVRGLTPLSKGLTQFEPVSESPTVKSQATESSGNYCSLIRLNHSTSCQNSTNINQNTQNATTGVNNNNSIIDTSKPPVPSNSNSNHSSICQHHHSSHHQQTYCQKQSQKLNNIFSSSQESTLENIDTGKAFSQIKSVTPHYNHNHVQTNIKPVPPPIETIPGKKFPEKRQRPTLPKLYLKNNSNNNCNMSKNGNNNSQKLLHHCHNQNLKANNNQSYSSPNSSNGNSPTVITKVAIENDLEPQSPLFHIRYKSLTNLQILDSKNPTLLIAGSIGQVPNDVKAKCTSSTKNKSNVKFGSHISTLNQQQDLQKSASATGVREGTLESSRSGGRTSGDSKLPEKKTRRLSRPRSLSNLVWDLKPSKDKSKKKVYIHQFDRRQQSTLYL